MFLYGGRRGIRGSESMKKNPLTPLFSRIRRFLYERTDDSRAPNRVRTKKRRIVHNPFAIVTLGIITGLGSILLGLFVFVMLLTLPYFVLGYLVWAAATGTAWIILRQHVKNLNRRDLESSD
jgi:hypothetical protein